MTYKQYIFGSECPVSFQSRIQSISLAPVFLLIIISKLDHVCDVSNVLECCCGSSVDLYRLYPPFIMSTPTYQMLYQVCDAPATAVSLNILLRCIHHFKSDLINDMDHMRISGNEPSSVILIQRK